MADLGAMPAFRIDPRKLAGFPAAVIFLVEQNGDCKQVYMGKRNDYENSNHKKYI